MATNEVEIKVTVDAEGATRLFNQLGEEIKGVETAAANTGEGFTRTEAKLVSLNAAVELGKTAASLLAGAFGAIPDAIERGASVDDITQSFEKLAAQAGSSGDAILTKLNTALADTIPNFDLMRQSNELLMGGLAPDDIETVAIAARALGEAMGTDAAQGMETLSDSLLRGDARALKSRGIIVDVEAAERTFAETLGKTREQLSQNERVIAVREESIRRLREESGRLGEVTVDAGDRLAQMSTILTNTKDRFFRAAANNQALNEALADLVKVLKGIDFTPIIEGLSGVVTFATKAIAALFKFREVVQATISPTNHAAGELGKLADKVGAAHKQFGNLYRDLGNAKTKADVQALSGAISKTRAEIEKLEDSSGKADMLKKLGDFAALAYEKMESLPKTIAKTKDSADRLSGATIDLNTGLKQTAPIATKVAEGIDGISTAASNATEEMLEFEAGLKDVASGVSAVDYLTSGLTKSSGGGEGGESSFFGDFFGKGTGDLADTIAGTLGTAITDGIRNGFDREDIGNTLSAVGKDFAHDFGITFLDPFIDLGGDFLNDAIESIFGGEHPGTTARKAADKFFADAFDANRLLVIIDGQLQQIEDLVFKGDTLFGGNSQFTDGSFANFFEGLPAAAQQAFSGVGLAFEELLGVSDDISGQIAAVLANNIGGSLNNLQLLVGATGKSFEELQGYVVEAFLDGKISALEAQSALQGLAQIAQKGIPDGIGFTVKAFENLKAAGEKGGRASIDALQDIAFEAKELGIRTFPELVANLAASGQFTAEEIQQVFDALATYGITSVDQLANATNAQLIPVLAQLQAQEFPFAEAANEASELINTLDKLPGEKSFTLNVKTNFDANTQTLAESGALNELNAITGPAGRGPSIP